MDELRAAARSMIPDTPSMDEICARARELIAEARLNAALHAGGAGGMGMHPA